jgi:hypothetical protein
MELSSRGVLPHNRTRRFFRGMLLTLSVRDLASTGIRFASRKDSGAMRADSRRCDRQAMSQMGHGPKSRPFPPSAAVAQNPDLPLSPREARSRLAMSFLAKSGRSRLYRNADWRLPAVCQPGLAGSAWLSAAPAWLNSVGPVWRSSG